LQCRTITGGRSIFIYIVPVSFRNRSGAKQIDMSQPFLGEIRMFGFGFAPNGWQPCNGQTLAISQYAALFALLGTTYGGNGTSTFQLPNLQSRVPVCQGSGAGLTPYVLGEQTGTESVTLLTTQMPAHSHAVNAGTTTSGNVAQPAGAYPATVQITGETKGGTVNTYSTASPNAIMNPNMIGPSGGNQPHPNIQPVLCVNFCIAMVGLFPSRN
jgi:microcystin-dependent protein